MPVDGHLDVEATRDAVAFTVTVENTTAEPVTLEFRSGLVVDVVVYDGDTEVWRWSEGRMFTQAVLAETVAPGDSFGREMAWTCPVPGDYVAAATLMTPEPTTLARIDFTVP